MGDNIPPDDTSVRVALRVRPQLAKEKIDMCQVCTYCSPDEPQVILGKDKAFTFDYVFDMNTMQDSIYNSCGRALIDGCFDGYNATIFAYGQTGSGKTYTMGTGFDMNITEEEIGIVPRAVQHLFNGIEQRRTEAQEKGEPPPDFKINAQFMELYNEEILDLLDTTRDPNDRNRKSHIRIHEDAIGGIYCVGVTTKQVNSYNDTIQCLKLGALSRTTASTNMNSQSSRSHAIFTLQVRQQRVVHDQEDENEEDKEKDTTEEGLNEFETLTAKFHFVDLAGSERLKRTGATGDRAKEGISINCGLLALGNVISALGDQAKKGSHVPYRDSKLTRLLQDSLGGNSRTVMIACVSPSDRDFMETLNTLKYANRARNIKNKVMVNQDKTSKQISALRQEIQILQVELLEYKMGKRMVDADGVESVNDMFHENTMLQTENNKLRQRIKAMQETVEVMTKRNSELNAQREAMNIANIGGEDAQTEIKALIERYVSEIEELRAKLIESEAMMETIKRSASARTPSRSGMSPRSPAVTTSLSLANTTVDFGLSPENHISDILQEAKQELSVEMRRMNRRARNRQRSHSSDKENESGGEKVDHEPAHPASSDVTGAAEEDDDRDDADQEDEDEEEEEEEETVDSISESEDDADNLHEDLADLTCEISIKQKLIEELEMSQKRLHTMKVQYEEKLVSLQMRIRSTEDERDKVLSSIGNLESHSKDKQKKVKEEYEKKLNDMQNEMKKVNAAKKEHAKLLRNQSHYEKQLKSLQRDLGDMKSYKVKLMNQIKEQSQKHRQSEAKRNKEIAQLKKDQLKKSSMIKSLETDKRQKELILKRKQEEVLSLRKRQNTRNVSAAVAGRVGRYDKAATVPVNPMSSQRRKKPFNPKAAKSKWDNLEKSVTSIIVKKQTLSHMEKDMERWLKQRENLRKKLDKFIKKRTKATKENGDGDMIRDLTEQIDSLHENINYVQENINDCQSNIMQMEEEETKDEEPEPTMMLDKCASLEEAKYLLEHFISLTINKGLLAAQKDSENKELMAKLHQERMDSTFQRDMLQYLIQDKVDIEIDDSLINMRDDSDTGSTSSSGSASPVDSDVTKVTSGVNQTALIQKLINLMENKEFQPINPAVTAAGSVANPTPFPMLPATLVSSPIGPHVAGESVSSSITSIAGRSVKARRKTTTPADLLFAPSGASGDLSPSSPQAQAPLEDERGARRLAGGEGEDRAPRRAAAVEGGSKRPTQPDSNLMPPPKGMPPKSRGNSGSYTQLPKAETNGPGRPDPTPSPSLARRGLPGATAKPEPSPTMRRKATTPSNTMSSSMTTSTSSGSLSRHGSTNDTSDLTPPTSPTLSRRNRSNNVFSRLTSQSQPASPHPTRGIITSAPNRSIKNQNAPLIFSHTAVGHTKAVLSVHATEDLMFSSSKDRTAKVWDLETGEEMLTLDGHPNNVVCVRYCPETRLVYTASTYCVRVWDVRQGNCCIMTVQSSGLANEGAQYWANNTRQVSCPAGETDVKDIALNSPGNVLYTAASNMVRIWDTRMWRAVGKLSGGHQAAVMVLAVDDTDTADGNICVVTGSKDHYIKVFEVMEDSVGALTPKFNLEPPHYDGIQSLCLMGDLLYSGSRDMCIKKWDLADQSLKQSINNAHKDWICGLAFMPGGNALLSGCRGGYLKLWHIDNSNMLGEIQAHNSPINAITTNSQLIFTASNDPGVKIWQPDWENMPRSVQEYYI